MRIYDLIEKKKRGLSLSKAEIEFCIDGFTDGSVPDYQMSALLMAIYFNGMSPIETTDLTLAMAHSGDVMNLSEIAGVKVDKHSSGGVGDKTSLVIAPIVAACSVPVAKMSGRGLGHTGGTIDKMESFPNLKTDIPKEEFIKIVQEIGLCITAQTGNLVPADKKIYALRDVTATVDSIPLIASSIMSKKIAAGSDCILLDVKTGSGAFMKTLDDSRKLAETMVDIGKLSGRTTIALITNMDIPLGHAIGNTLEIIEVIEILKGRGPKDLSEISLAIAAHMLVLAGKGDFTVCEKMAHDAVQSGAAIEKFKSMIKALGGDENLIDDVDKFEKASINFSVKSPSSGYVSSMDAEKIGISAMILGAGRETSADAIDMSAGIMLTKKTGEFVNKGDDLAVLYTNKNEALEKATSTFLDGISFSKEKPAGSPLIYDVIK